MSYCLFVVDDWVLKETVLQIDEASMYTKKEKYLSFICWI
jgi:hypothetical protein